MAEVTLKSQILSIILVVFFAVYVNYPAPKLSERVLKWRYGGKYFSYEGYAVFYRDDVGSGNPDSVVVCIHGFPTSSYDMSKIWDKLKTKFGRVIAIDMLGFGFSDKPLNREYTVKEQATIFEMLLHSLGITHVNLLAHDLGDTVALEMLARFDEKKQSIPSLLTLNSLCLSNGGIFPETNFPKLIQKLMLIPWLSPLLVRIANYRVFCKSLSDTFGPNTKPTSEECQDFYSLHRHKDGHLVVPSLMRYIIQRQENKERWVGAMQKSSIPIHFIYGPADPINPPAVLQRFRRMVSKGSYTELTKDIGHYPNWEDPDGFIQGYFGYLKKVRKEG